MENEFDYVKDLAKDYRQEPSDRVWSSIENGLSHDKITKKLSIYKYLSIAAVGVGVIAAILLVQLYAKQHNPDLFAYSETTDLRPIVIETLGDSEQEGLYAYAMKTDLTKAYKNASFKYNSHQELKIKGQ